MLFVEDQRTKLSDTCLQIPRDRVFVLWQVESVNAELRHFRLKRLQLSSCGETLIEKGELIWDLILSSEVVLFHFVGNLRSQSTSLDEGVSLRVRIVLESLQTVRD